MFDWFFGKSDTKKIKDETRRGFESVKRDIQSVGGWIKHLDSEKELHKKEINDIKDVLSTIKEDIDELKNIVSIIDGVNSKKMFKTSKQLFNKQTAVYAVQTDVQTDVQTPNLDQFSVSERAILWVLLNTDLKLSYDDIAAVLGKERSTIRGQINAIKSKSEGIVEEISEKNGKKRVFIPEEVKEKLLKKTKVRVNSNKSSKKEENK
jgi:biotin operon repressor